MKTKYYIVAALLAAGVAAAGERVERSQLPRPVQQAIDQAGTPGMISSVTKRSEGGRVVYDVAFARDNAPDHRILIAEDGTVVRRDGSHASPTSISTSTAPSAARANATTATASTPAGTTVAVDDDDDDLRDVDVESMVALDKLPSAVQQTISKEAAGRGIADIDRESFSGKTVYEVEFREQGINEQIHIAEDGTLVRDDGSVRRAARNLFGGTQVEDTPQTVQDVIHRELAGREVADVDKERRSGRVVYEVEVDDDEGQFQLHIAEDGTIVKDGRVAAE